MVSLIGEARKNFEDRQIYLKFCRRFWTTLIAYNYAKDYKPVLQMFFLSLCKDNIISHEKIVNTNLNN